jgi:hypothetical protein
MSLKQSGRYADNHSLYETGIKSQLPHRICNLIPVSVRIILD